jgi:hypothetical protein
MLATNKSSVIDIALAIVFLCLGLALVVNGVRLPSGAGFFPKVLGCAVIGLSIALLVQGVRMRVPYTFSVGHPRVIVSLIVLTSAYLLLWGVGWFPLRTLIFLLLFLRMLGDTWRVSVAVSTVLVVGVTATFQYGLNISLQ